MVPAAATGGSIRDRIVLTECRKRTGFRNMAGKR